jgi:hypothetical protein
MQQFRIFTEGKGDVRFIDNYINEIFGIQLADEDFDILGSWSGYKAGGQLKTAIQQNSDDKKHTIIILDADDNFAERQAEVLKDFAGYNIQDVSLFLFPNNSDKGNMEEMLARIAVDDKLISCFSHYEQCIQGYELPVSKARIFAYLDALLPARNKKDNKNNQYQPENRNYNNTAHWNLRHEYLNPFHDFLKRFF